MIQVDNRISAICMEPHFAGKDTGEHCHRPTDEPSLGTSDTWCLRCSPECEEAALNGAIAMSGLGGRAAYRASAAMAAVPVVNLSPIIQVEAPAVKMKRPKVSVTVEAPAAGPRRTTVRRDRKTGAMVVESEPRDEGA